MNRILNHNNLGVAINRPAMLFKHVSVMSLMRPISGSASESCGLLLVVSLHHTFQFFWDSLSTYMYEVFELRKLHPPVVQ